MRNVSADVRLVAAAICVGHQARTRQLWHRPLSLVVEAL